MALYKSGQVDGGGQSSGAITVLKAFVHHLFVAIGGTGQGVSGPGGGNPVESWNIGGSGLKIFTDSIMVGV